MKLVLVHVSLLNGLPQKLLIIVNFPLSQMFGALVYF